MKHLSFPNALFHGLGLKNIAIYIYIPLILENAKIQVVVDYQELKKQLNFLKATIVSYHLLQKLRMDTLQILFIYSNIINV